MNDYREILYVGDWTDRLILLSEKELEEIKQLEICFDMWDEHEVCPEMLDERNLSCNSITEDNDDFSLDINSISEAVSSFFNKFESTIEKNNKELK